MILMPIIMASLQGIMTFITYRRSNENFPYFSYYNAIITVLFILSIVATTIFTANVDFVFLINYLFT